MSSKKAVTDALEVLTDQTRKYARDEDKGSRKFVTLDIVLLNRSKDRTEHSDLPWIIIGVDLSDPDQTYLCIPIIGNCSELNYEPEARWFGESILIPAGELAETLFSD